MARISLGAFIWLIDPCVKSKFGTKGGGGGGY